MTAPSMIRFLAAAAAVLALVLASLAQGSGRQEEPAEAHWAEGLSLAQGGQLPAAEEQLRTAVSLKPGNAKYLSSLATVLALQKKFEESDSWFEKALRLDPADLLSRRHLSANLWQLHRYSEAKRQLERILRADPRDSQSRLLLGLVAEKTGDFSESAA